MDIETGQIFEYVDYGNGVETLYALCPQCGKDKLRENTDNNDSWSCRLCNYIEIPEKTYERAKVYFKGKNNGIKKEAFLCHRLLGTFEKNQLKNKK